MTSEHFCTLKKIGYLVRFYRRHKELTQFQMAELLNISHRSLQRLELGEAEPKLETLHNISKVLNISLTALLRPTDAAILSLRHLSTPTEFKDFRHHVIMSESEDADLEFAQKIITQDKIILPKSLEEYHAYLDGQRVLISEPLSELIGINGRIENIDDHIIFGSSLERWELTFRLGLKQAIIENYYMFPNGFKAFEEFHFNIHPNPEAPTSECYIRDITHRNGLENWIKSLKERNAVRV